MKTLYPRLLLVTGLMLLAIHSVFAQPSLEPLEVNAPMELASFEVPVIKIVPVVTDLANPYAMAFRRNGDILISERYTGKLKVVRQGTTEAIEISGMPAVYSEVFRAGLMDIGVHPDDDSLVYMTYTKPLAPELIEEDGPEQTVAMARGRLVEDRLVELSDLFIAKDPDSAISASVLLFAPDNTLFMSLGGAAAYAGVGELAQDPESQYGKLLRFNDDGSVPADNPFVDSGEYLPEVYSVGHRNQLGLTFHPDTGELWASENGPQGGDEINRVQAGANYGWPNVSFSRHYRGDWVNSVPGHAEYLAPDIMFWPSIAPGAITFYSGDKIPKWQGNLFVGSMMTGRIPGTGHLERIVFNPRGQEIRRETLLGELKSRIREVEQGPDGYLYVLTDEEEGALLRIEAANQ